MGRPGRFLFPLALVASSAITSGCSALGNLLIPWHPNSYHTDGVLRLEFSRYDVPAGQELADVPPHALTGPAEVVAGLLAGIASTQVRKAVEAEGRRYDARYSASGYALASELPLRITASRFSKGSERDELLRLKLVLMRPKPSFPAVRLLIEEVSVSKVASKVYWPIPYSLWDWWKLTQIPASLAWLPWRALDESISEVELKIHVELEAITANARAVRVINTDLPLGKASIDDLSYLACKSYFLAGDSDIRELGDGVHPKCAQLSSQLEVFPQNTTGWNALITIEEGNRLGDVIGDAAEKARASEGDIARAILRALGFEDETEGQE